MGRGERSPRGGTGRQGSFGANLRHFRHEAGLAQEHLAERAGPGQRTIAYAGQACGLRPQFAYDRAESQYRELVELLEHLRHVPDAARARESLGEILSRTGRYDDMLTVLERAATVLEAVGDVGSPDRATVDIGAAHGSRGTPAGGINQLGAS